MTLTLTGGLVVTSLDPPSVVEGDLVVEGDRVAAVGSPERLGEFLDCSGKVVLPGNVCAHMHLYSVLARGMPFRLAPPMNFVEILQRVWWRLDRALDEESIRASALIGGTEALLSGTTTLVDHHASPNAIDGSLDVIAEALESLGVRSILCYEVSDRDGARRAAAGIEENRRFLRRADLRLTRGMVGAHASFTLSEETLAGCVELSREGGHGIHIHVAEDGADQADARARFGVPVVERLAEAGAVTPRSLLAHCVQVHPTEIGRILQGQATVAHNPRSNMNNGVGHAPVEVMDDAVALGTDGLGSDMFAESQTAYWRSRERSPDVDAAWPLRCLARGAAFAGGVFGTPTIGRIQPGAPADVVVLDYQPPAPMTSGSLSGHWLFGLSAARVRDVIVAGDIVVRDHRLTKVDQDELSVKAATEAGRLWERLESVDAHPFAPRRG